MIYGEKIRFILNHTRKLESLRDAFNQSSQIISKIIRMGDGFSKRFLMMQKMWAQTAPLIQIQGSRLRVNRIVLANLE